MCLLARTASRYSFVDFFFDDSVLGGSVYSEFRFLIWFFVEFLGLVFIFGGILAIRKS